ncbi:hypothetical protein [Bacillus paranthracis]|uniref:hypothetical protein n=1 Tax=Bacillus paranthracis TaxID=2026186 RepID=UPI0022DEDE3A|nr:hypothetical protein [Bacillus paranthracis]
MISFIRLSLPFVSLILLFVFRISDYIVPLHNIQDPTRNAIDIAFNTFLLNAVLEFLDKKVLGKHIYSVSITGKKGQDIISLDSQAAESPFSIKCNIELVNGKPSKKVTEELVLTHPKWISIQLEDTKYSSLIIINDDNTVTFKLGELFNHKSTGPQSQTFLLMVIPSEFKKVKGEIQGELKNKGFLRFSSASVKSLKVQIHE